MYSVNSCTVGLHRNGSIGYHTVVAVTVHAKTLRHFVGRHPVDGRRQLEILLGERKELRDWISCTYFTLSYYRSNSSKQLQPWTWMQEIRRGVAGYFCSTWILGINGLLDVPSQSDANRNSSAQRATSGRKFQSGSQCFRSNILL